MLKEYYISTHMLLHRCMFYVSSMSCTDGTKSKYGNTTYDSKTQESPVSVVNILGHTYAIYKLIDNTCTNALKLPSIVLKLLRRYPFMYQVNKGHNSVKIELAMICLKGIIYSVVEMVMILLVCILTNEDPYLYYEISSSS